MVWRCSVASCNFQLGVTIWHFICLLEKNGKKQDHLSSFIYLSNYLPIYLRLLYKYSILNQTQVDGWVDGQVDRQINPGDWFSDPLWIPKSIDAKDSYRKNCNIAYNLCTSSHIIQFLIFIMFNDILKSFELTYINRDFIVIFSYMCTVCLVQIHSFHYISIPFSFLPSFSVFGGSIMLCSYISPIFFKSALDYL